MLHLIVYDIGDDRRLRRVASVCEDYGRRVEKSVFECNLKDEDFKVMWKRLSDAVCIEVDRVIDYPVGMMDRQKIRSLGDYCPWERPQILIF